MDFQSHPHWSALKKIYHTFHQHGYKAYLAGGCVRDALLGFAANDFDIATDATPETIEGLFKKTIAVGKAFGVMVVIEDGVPCEVATFRSDGLYVDGRRPSEVVFTSAEEDAKRRDFTVNALFYDLNEGRVLDFVGGLKDLADKKIKAVGDPELRFREDHLRILRALRFASQLGFTIEAETLTACRRFANLVESVSPERVSQEIVKLLASKDPFGGLRLLDKTGVGDVLFENYSQLFRMHQKEFQVLFASPQKDATLNWGKFLAPWALAADSGWQRILARYRFSRQDSRSLHKAMELIQHPDEFFARAHGDRLASLSDEGIRLFLTLAIALGIHANSAEDLMNAWKLWGEKMPEAWVTGDDLKGRFQGRELGNWLYQLYVWQLEQKYRTREELLAQLPSP